MFGLPGDFNLGFFGMFMGGEAPWAVLMATASLGFGGFGRRSSSDRVDRQLVSYFLFVCDILSLSIHQSNELNASYAAHGYARIGEGTLGVIITTYVIHSLYTRITILQN